MTVLEAEVSPDGTAVVSRVGRKLSIRRFDAPGETVFKTDVPIDVPAWSPDASHVAFAAFSGLYRVRISNGETTAICPLPDRDPTRGLTWSRNGTLLVAAISYGFGYLYAVPASGGSPQRLDVPGMSDGAFFLPEFLPDGEKFLFAWCRQGDEEIGLYLSSLKGNRVTEPVLLRKGSSAGHYSESNSGELLYVEADNLYAQSLSTVGPARLTGKPRLVMESVYSSGRLRQAYFSVSRNGVLVYTAGRAEKGQLTWFDRRGKVLGTAGPPCETEYLRQSPDGSHILVSPFSGWSRIVESGRDGHLLLPGVERGLWTRDGSRVIYRQIGERGDKLMERAITSGAVRELFSLEDRIVPRDLSPDGKSVLYSVNRSLYVLRIDSSSAQPQRFLELEGRLQQAKFAPDGNWIVYTEEDRIYVQRFPSGGVRTQISTDRGRDPVWRGDGKEIVYYWNSSLFSVGVEIRGSAFKGSQPERLFGVKPPAVVGMSEITGVSNDGSQILYAQVNDASYPPTVYVVTSWTEGR